MIDIRINFDTWEWCLVVVKTQEPIGKTYASYKRAYWAKQTLEAL